MKYNIYDTQLEEYYLTDITLDEAKDTAIRVLERWIDEEDDEEYKEKRKECLTVVENAKTFREISFWLYQFGYDLEMVEENPRWAD